MLTGNIPYVGKHIVYDAPLLKSLYIFTKADQLNKKKFYNTIALPNFFGSLRQFVVKERERASDAVISAPPSPPPHTYVILFLSLFGHMLKDERRSRDREKEKVEKGGKKNDWRKKEMAERVMGEYKCLLGSRDYSTIQIPKHPTTGA